jgi:hypothetical protein
MAATIVAVRLMAIDSRTIANSAGSPARTKCNADALSTVVTYNFSQPRLPM